MDNWFQKLCDKLTGHRWRKLEGWTEEEPKEYYWRCRICRKVFWNYGEKHGGRHGGV